MPDDSFTYTDYAFSNDNKTVEFNYELIHGSKKYSLSEKLTFPTPLDIAVIHPTLRALHLALGISYYKIFLPPTISYSYDMPKKEAEFWNDVYQNGLGEFLYVNKLPKERIASFQVQDSQKNKFADINLNNSALLGIGGGKDSIVAGELLKSIGIGVSGFVMATGEQLGQTKSVAEVMGVYLYAVERILDKQLLTLQEEPNAYKGHVPISLIFALVGVVLALNERSKYVVVANEASASIPSINWNGTAVNHQWSKSFQFEAKLQEYIKNHIHPKITYFSAIRPLSSVAVAKRFANYPQYFEAFTSDNYVFRIDSAKRPNGRWSLESPKSLSSFILLAPWMSDDDMNRTFGRNFLDEASLEPLFLSLTGKTGDPPLDCVGTVDELILSLNLLENSGRHKDSILMNIARDNKIIEPKNWDLELEKLIELSPDNAFPPEISKKLLEGLNK